MTDDQNDPGTDPNDPTGSNQSATAASQGGDPTGGNQASGGGPLGGADPLPSSVSQSESKNGHAAPHDAVWQDMLKELRDAKEERGELVKGKRAATSAMIDTLEAGRQNLTSQPLPDLKEIPQQPSAQQLGKGAMEYMQVATALGALAGGLGRRNATFALNAFGSAIKGFTEGNRQQYEASIEEWKEASTRLKENNQTKIDQYNMIFNNKKLSMDMKLAQIKIVAQEYDDEITYNMADSKQYQALGLAMGRQEDLQRKLEDDHNKSVAVTDKIRLSMELAQGQVLSPDSIKTIAEQYLAGDKSAITNLSRGPSGGRNIMAVRDAITQLAKERNMSGADVAAKVQDFSALTAGLRATYTREANIGTAVQTALDSGPLLAQSVNQSAGTGLAIWSEAEGRWAAQKGDPKYQDMVARVNTFNNLYARAISGGVSTVSGQTHAREMLSPNMPRDAMKAQIRAMMQEMQIEKQAPGKVREKMKMRPLDQISKEDVIPDDDIFGQGGGGNAGGGGDASGGKPQQVIQNGHTYDLQPDGTYK
jgi:hypothetical protein